MKKNNKFTYFGVYFNAVIINVVINTYLPIYFYNILNVDKSELAFVQIISYIFLFTKPIFSIFVDKKKFNYKKRLIAFVMAIGVTLSFIFLILSIEILILFGFFTGFNFAFFSILDITVDKNIIENSPDDKTKTKNNFIMQIGGFFGTIIALGIPLFLNFDSPNVWSIYFIVNLILISLLIPITYRMNGTSSKVEILENRIPDQKASSFNILMMFIYIFLAYSDQLFQYPFEPWALEKYFGGNINLFSLYSLVLTVISLPGFIIALLFSDRIGKRKILIVSSIIVGIMLIIAPFLDFMGFIILTSIYLLMGGIILINLGALMMKVSKGKVMYFQIIAIGIVLAKLILIPSGTYLSSYVPTEFIVMISGIMYFISIIPLLLLKFDKNESSFQEKM